MKTLTKLNEWKKGYEQGFKDGYKAREESTTEIIGIPKESNCLHDTCSECGGTGYKKNGMGMCVHFISCPCPKCTPRC